MLDGRKQALSRLSGMDLRATLEVDGSGKLNALVLSRALKRFDSSVFTDDSISDLLGALKCTPDGGSVVIKDLADLVELITPPPVAVEKAEKDEFTPIKSLASTATTAPPSPGQGAATAGVASPAETTLKEPNPAESTRTEAPSALPSTMATPLEASPENSTPVDSVEAVSGGTSREMPPELAAQASAAEAAAASAQAGVASRELPAEIAETSAAPTAAAPAQVVAPAPLPDATAAAKQEPEAAAKAEAAAPSPAVEASAKPEAAAEAAASVATPAPVQSGEPATQEAVREIPTDLADLSAKVGGAAGLLGEAVTTAGWGETSSREVAPDDVKPAAVETSGAAYDWACDALGPASPEARSEAVKLSPVEEACLRVIFQRCDLKGDGFVNKADLIKTCEESPSVAAFFGLSQLVRYGVKFGTAAAAVFQTGDTDQPIAWDAFKKLFADRVLAGSGFVDAAKAVISGDSGAEIDKATEGKTEALMMLRDIFSKACTGDQKKVATKAELQKVCEEQGHAAVFIEQRRDILETTAPKTTDGVVLELAGSDQPDEDATMTLDELSVFYKAREAGAPDSTDVSKSEQAELKSIFEQCAVDESQKVKKKDLVSVIKKSQTACIFFAMRRNIFEKALSHTTDQLMKALFAGLDSEEVSLPQFQKALTKKTESAPALCLE